MQAAFNSQASAFLNFQTGFDARNTGSFGMMPAAGRFQQPVSQYATQFRMSSFSGFPSHQGYPSFPGSVHGQSKTSSTYFSQQSMSGPNGRSESTFYQHVSTSNQRGRDNHTQDLRFDNGSYYSQQSSWRRDEHRTSDRFDDQASHFGRQQNDWKVAPVKDNKTRVDLENYTLDFDKHNSSILLRDKQSGDTTKISGDPHINMHAGTGQQTDGMFDGTLGLVTRDGTKITVHTDGNGKASHANTVDIERGGEKIEVDGLSETNSKPLTVQRLNNTRSQSATPPADHTIIAKKDGSGWIDPRTHKEPDFKK